MVYSLAEKLLRQTLVVTAVQDWGTCHHCGLLQLQGFYKLLSCQLLPLILDFCLGFGKTFTPRIPTWSPGVGGALCSNRSKSDLSCFLPEQKFHRPSRGITSAPGLNLEPKARYFVLFPTFLDLKLCRCLATLLTQTFSSKGLDLLVSVLVFFIGWLVKC